MIELMDAGFWVQCFSIHATLSLFTESLFAFCFSLWFLGAVFLCILIPLFTAMFPFFTQQYLTSRMHFGFWTVFFSALSSLFTRPF